VGFCRYTKAPLQDTLEPTSFFEKYLRALAGNVEDEEDYENDDSSERHSRAGQDANDSTLELLDIDNKMNDLMELYHVLRPSFLKARGIMTGTHVT
jgi:hypothetical protein